MLFVDLLVFISIVFGEDIIGEFQGIKIEGVVEKPQALLILKHADVKYKHLKPKREFSGEIMEDTLDEIFLTN